MASPSPRHRLAACLERCEAANAGAPITFFEITTAAAFLAFAEEPADWVLLETGLGGRLDATNVVAKPRLCLITPVSMDHESYLGDTLAQDRVREGRHPQARRAGGARAAAAGGAGGDRGACGRGRGTAPGARPRLAGPSDARRNRRRDRRAAAGSAALAAGRRASDRQCGAGRDGSAAADRGRAGSGGDRAGPAGRRAGRRGCSA